MNEQDKIRIARSVGIHINEMSGGVRFFDSVPLKSKALAIVIGELAKVERKFAFQFISPKFGMQPMHRFSNESIVALRLTRKKLRMLEQSPDPEMKYCTRTAGDYLDDVLAKCISEESYAYY